MDLLDHPTLYEIVRNFLVDLGLLSIPVSIIYVIVLIVERGQKKK